MAIQKVNAAMCAHIKILNSVLVSKLYFAILDIFSFTLGLKMYNVCMQQYMYDIQNLESIYPDKYM